MDKALWFFNIINTFLIFEYMRKTYGFKYKQKYINAAVITIFYFIHVWINLQYDAMLNLIAELIMFNVLGYLFFKRKTGKFYFNAIYQFYLIAVDLIISSTLVLITKIEFTKLHTNDLLIYAIALVYIIDLLTYRKVIRLFRCELDYLEKSKRIFLSVAILIQFVLLASISYFYNIYIVSMIGIFAILYISIINTSSLMFVMHRINTLKMRELARFQDAYSAGLVKETQAEEQRLNALSRIYRKHITHDKDIKTQDELNAHLKNIQKDISIDLQKYSDKTVNIIMTQLNLRADKLSIKLKEDIEQIEWSSFVDNNDLMIIMSSIIDNAIETIDGDKELEIFASQTENLTMLRIKHTCDISKIEKKNNMIYPSADSSVRMRTQIAYEFLQKIGGDISFKTNNNKFTVRIYFKTKQRCK